MKTGKTAQMCIFILVFTGHVTPTSLAGTYFSLSRYITKLLSDLIYFVTMQEAENTGGDPLDVEMKNPNDSRERQKLLREQNIVKQVNLLLIFRVCG